MRFQRKSTPHATLVGSRIPMVLTLVLFVAVLAVPFVAFMLYGLVRLVAPTRIGPHRHYFAACLAIPRNATPTEVLTRMQGYVLAQRSGALRVTPELLVKHPLPTVRHGSSASFLFYPNSSDTAGWCGVEFEEGLVQRTWVSPD